MADRTRNTTWRSTHTPLRAGLAVLLALPVLTPPGLAVPAAAQEAAMNAPDFSDVTTKAAARKLVREGRLVRITLFPYELGGSDEPENVAFITPEAALVRELVIGTIGRFFEEGSVDKLEVVPEYRGDSVVPSSITMTAWHSGQEGEIATTIPVW